MTLQLNWPAEIVERLRGEARQRGLSLDDYLLKILLGKLPQQSPPGPTEEQTRKARQEAGRSIRELSKGNSLGPDLTIRDLVEDGRRY